MPARTGSSLIALAGAFALLSSPSAAYASCVPGFDFAAFGDQKVTFGGTSDVDSYNSATGQLTPQRTGGNVCTNGIIDEAVDVFGQGQVYGNACSGAGSDPDVAISTDGIAGTRYAQTTSTVLTPVVVPTISPSYANPSCGTCTLSPGAYDTVNITGTATLTAGTYRMNNLRVSSQGKIIVGSGPIVVYLTGDLDLQGQSVTNPTLKSTDLIFLVAGTSPDVKIAGGNQAAFAVYAPGRNIELRGNSDIYGAIVGKTVDARGAAGIHYDRALADVGAGHLQCPPIELARSTPIVVPLEGTDAIIQGTYEHPFPTRTEVTGTANVSAFRFPYLQGHLRARDANDSDIGTAGASFTSTNVTQVIPDGKDGIPNVTYAGCTDNFTPSCRTVFTTTTAPDFATSRAVLAPESKFFKTGASAAEIGALITAGLSGFTSTHYDTLISRILAGNEVSTGVFAPKLGGLDRSTAAVIPPSLVAGGARPTMIYVGGTDGMLHAYCAETFTNPENAGEQWCVEGKELWAFVPRVLLPDLRRNLAIIDGSPRVVDMFGTFGTGVAQFRSVLFLTTGTGERTANKTPAIYAIDVTDPRAPLVLWEYTWDASSPRAHELGKGQMLAAGVTNIGGTRRNVLWAQTNNGASLPNSANAAGTGAAASVLVALDAETGTEIFAPRGYNYPAQRSGANPAVPWQGVPGGAVAVDKTQSGRITDVVFTTLYGDLWVVDPATGDSKYTTAGPLFRVSADLKPIGAPPAIYSYGGTIFAAFGTGSYWDRSGASLWNTAATQHVVGVSLATPTTITSPLTEASGAPYVPYVRNLTGGQRVSSQIYVVGNEIFFATETANINASSYGVGSVTTGAAYSYNLTNGTSTSDTLVVSGVASLARAGTKIIASGARGSEVVNNVDADAATSNQVAGASSKLTRRLWLRTL